MAGWIHIVPNPNTPPCKCHVPNRDAIARMDAHDGSQWQCFHCDKTWTLTSDGNAWCPAEPTG